MGILAALIVVSIATGFINKQNSKTRLIIYVLLLVAMILTLVTDLTKAAAQCSPFTRQAQPGMLAIGTVVDIVNYELVAPNTVSAVTRTGTVDEYYITTYCPQAAIFNMDAQAYVIRYGAVDGSRRIVDSGELTVR